MTDLLYKHPEGSFLPGLIKMSNEGGTGELTGTEPGLGLNLVEETPGPQKGQARLN